MNDYHLFVDASGDDGLKFEKGSSSCFVASNLIVKTEDIKFNKSILAEIKRLMGAKAKDEVKYHNLRRLDTPHG